MIFEESTRRKLLSLVEHRRPLTEGLKFVQRTRTPEFSTELLSDLAQRLFKSVLGPLASKTKVRIEMRAKTRGDGMHFSSTVKGWHIIHIKQHTTSLHNLATTIAHELAHVRQYELGHVKTAVVDGVQGNEWHGKFYPNTAHYSTLPWEREAESAEARGEEVLHRMEAEGVDLRSERMKISKGPTIADLAGMSGEEIRALMKKLRAKK